MKKSILIITGILMSVFAFSQTDSTRKENTMSKKMPPLSMLPKNPGEMKMIYELPKECEYQIFDEMGNFLSKGKAEFIDYTDYKKGKYFIKFENQTETFSHN